MRRRCVQRRKVRSDQVSLAISEMYIAFGKLGATGPQALGFPAFEHQAGFKLVLNEIVVARFAVNGNDIVGRFFFLLGAHFSG